MVQGEKSYGGEIQTTSGFVLAMLLICFMTMLLICFMTLNKSFKHSGLQPVTGPITTVSFQLRHCILGSTLHRSRWHIRTTLRASHPKVNLLSVTVINTLSLEHHLRLPFFTV